MNSTKSLVCKSVRPSTSYKYIFRRGPKLPPFSTVGFFDVKGLVVQLAARRQRDFEYDVCCRRREAEAFNLVEVDLPAVSLDLCTDADDVKSEKPTCQLRFELIANRVCIS